MQLRHGGVIAGRYRLLRPLGEGGIGVVWAATHVVTRKAVALKFLKANDSDTVRRFLREARVASAVNHPNVVSIHDVVQERDQPPVMVMDLLEGEPLSALLARRGSVACSEAARILLPVVSAVGTAHALGVVHRDLKPDNIFLVGELDQWVDVKVLDFGIAKLTATEGDAAQTSGLTTTGAMLGTPHYMAPEQVYGERDVDHRADVWALGVILYEALSGRRPVGGDDVGQILKAITLGPIPPLATRVAHVPAELAGAVDAMLARDRNARLADLRVLFALLARHTEQAAQSFGAAIAAPRSEPRSEPPRNIDADAPPGSAEITQPMTEVRLQSPQRISARPIGSARVHPSDSTAGLIAMRPSDSTRTVPLPWRRTRTGRAATLAIIALFTASTLAFLGFRARRLAAASLPSRGVAAVVAAPKAKLTPAVTPAVPVRTAAPASTPGLPGGVHGGSPR